MPPAYKRFELLLQHAVEGSACKGTQTEDMIATKSTRMHKKLAGFQHPRAVAVLQLATGLGFFLCLFVFFVAAHFRVREVVPARSGRGRWG
jgi:hypothetical protein